MKNLGEMYNQAHRLAGLLDAAGTLHGERANEDTVGALLAIAEDMALGLRDDIDAAEKEGAA